MNDNLLKKTRQITLELMEKFPELRSNNNRLIANVWSVQFGKENMQEKLTMKELLSGIPHLASIEKILETKEMLMCLPQFSGEEIKTVKKRNHLDTWDPELDK